MENNMTIDNLVQDNEVVKQPDVNEKSLLQKGVRYAGVTVASLASLLAVACNNVDTSGTMQQAKPAYSEPIKNVSIDVFYNNAEPLNNSNFPDGTRYQAYGNSEYAEKLIVNKVRPGKTAIGNWRLNDQFKSLYQTKDKGQKIQNIFKNYGVDLNLFENLINSVSDEMAVSVFDSGKVIVFDYKSNEAYIFKAKEGISTKISNDVYGIR